MLFLTVFCVLFRVNGFVSRHFSGVSEHSSTKQKYYKGRTSGSKEWLAGRDISLFHQHILHGARPCCQLPALFGRKIYAKTIDFIYRGKRNFDDHPLFYEMVAIKPPPSKEILRAKSDGTEKIHEDDRFWCLRIIAFFYLIIVVDFYLNCVKILTTKHLWFIRPINPAVSHLF